MSDYDLNWDNSTERAVAALRARLAEVEAERDAANESRAWWINERSTTISADLAAAEARLGEAVELLRRSQTQVVDPGLYADLRAFLAAQEG